MRLHILLRLWIVSRYTLSHIVLRVHVKLKVVNFSHGGGSVSKSCLTLCHPLDCSTPGLPVLHYLLEFAQTHVRWVSDAIQSSHALLPPYPAFSLSQHLQWVGSSYYVAKVLELQLQSFQWIFSVPWLPLTVTCSWMYCLFACFMGNSRYVWWLGFICSVGEFWPCYSRWLYPWFQGLSQ